MGVVHRWSQLILLHAAGVQREDGPGVPHHVAGSRPRISVCSVQIQEILSCWSQELTIRYLHASNIGILSSCLVLVWPFKETPGKISVFKDSPEVTSWIQAEITFRNVANVFLLMFRTGGPTTRQDALYLAVDDVIVTSGRCNNV